MKVGELVSILQKLDENLSVTITDGFKGKTYHGQWPIIEFEEDDDTKTVDIGIGGTLIDDIPLGEE